MTMAQVPADVSFTIRDGLGTTAAAHFNGTVDDTGTVAATRTYLNSLQTALDGVIDGVITDSRLTVHGATLDNSAKLATDAFTDSRVEQTAVINLSPAGGAPGSGHRYGQAIPSISDSAIADGKITVGSVAALVALLTTPAAITITNLAAQALPVVVDYVLSFRKHRRSLARTSFEL